MIKYANDLINLLNLAKVYFRNNNNKKKPILADYKEVVDEF